MTDICISYTDILHVEYAHTALRGLGFLSVAAAASLAAKTRLHHLCPLPSACCDCATASGEAAAGGTEAGNSGDDSSDALRKVDEELWLSVRTLRRQWLNVALHFAVRLLGLAAAVLAAAAPPPHAGSHSHHRHHHHNAATRQPMATAAMLPVVATAAARPAASAHRGVAAPRLANPPTTRDDRTGAGLGVGAASEAEAEATLAAVKAPVGSAARTGGPGGGEGGEGGCPPPPP
eukprot:GHVU01057052.1.p1 GENE.GHVU01057052.1~~GHVU01057052.1.p1  ORF type:complete len:234 (-),score=52.53 GHVU01057052.1:179-880(-)